MVRIDYFLVKDFTRNLFKKKILTIRELNAYRNKFHFFHSD